VQTEPAKIVVPQVVDPEFTAKCESVVEKGLVMLRLSVPALVRLCSFAGEVAPAWRLPKSSVGFA